MKFVQVSRLEESIKLPERSTKGSAGYDFFAIEDVIIPAFSQVSKPQMVKTGVKVELGEGTFLMLANRSSNPGKKNLVIPNSVGIIDSDYYNNIDNEGEIAFSFYNVGEEAVVIEKGDKLGQGIILPFMTVEDDNATGERSGGFGSTGE